jgi:hypothetical protein
MVQNHWRKVHISPVAMWVRECITAIAATPLHLPRKLVGVRGVPGNTRCPIFMSEVLEE